MAYITKSNMLSIVRKTDMSKIDLKGQAYKTKIYFFNKYEEKELLVVKEFIKDPEKFFNELYVSIGPRKDTFTYIFEYEGKKPAYHKIPNCERLNSDYANFIIPKEIKDKGPDHVKEFRVWFKSVAELFNRDKEAFVARLFLKYKIQTNPEALEKDNSGIEYFSNIDIKDLENKIDSLIKEAGRYYYQSERNTKILKKYSSRAFLGSKNEDLEDNDTGYPNQEVKDFLKEYDHKFKIPLKTMLKEFYRIQFNPSLEFNGLLLDKLGFKPCGNCYADGNYADEIESPSNKNNLPVPIGDDLPF